MLTTYRQLFALFDRTERRQVFVLLVLVTLMALIDLIGVAAVLPFLAVAADPEIAQRNTVLAMVYERSGVSSDREFLLLLGGVVLAFILVGLGVKLAGQYRIIRFGHACNHSFSRRLLARYLSLPYAWRAAQQRRSRGSDSRECDRVVSFALLPALKTLAQSISLLCLVGLLVVVSPSVALSAALGIGATYTLIFRFTRWRLMRLGERQVSAQAARHRVALEAFGGIKDIKLMGLEARYGGYLRDSLHVSLSRPLRRPRSSASCRAFFWKPLLSVVWC